MMKRLMTTVAAGLAGIAINGAATAGVTDSQVAQMMQAKGFKLLNSSASSDRKTRSGIWGNNTEFYGVIIIDANNDGTAELLQIFSSVLNTQSVGMQAYNTWNKAGWFTAYKSNRGLAVLHDTDVQIGNTSINNVSANVEFFRSRSRLYTTAMRSLASGTQVGVSVGVGSDPYALDEGMSRVEVKARDAALAAKLNQTRGTFAHEQHPHVKALIELSDELMDEIELP